MYFFKTPVLKPKKAHLKKGGAYGDRGGDIDAVELVGDKEADNWKIIIQEFHSIFLVKWFSLGYYTIT